MKSPLVWMAVSCLAACSTAPDLGPRIRTIAGQNSENTGFADGDALDDAMFDLPEGLVLDAKGENLYIADSLNHAIRRLDLSTHQVTTIAGVGGEHGSNDSSPGVPAHLRLPRAMVMTPDGQSLWFTDSGNNTIRKLDLASGTVTTPFGTAGEAGATDGVGTDARFSQSSLGAQWPGGIALDASGTTMYVLDSANETVRAIDLTTSTVSTLAGKLGVDGFEDGVGQAAVFNKALGLVLDDSGHLYITEGNNIDIRKLDLANDLVVTVAGRAPLSPYQYCEIVSSVQPPECGSNDAPNGLDARFRFPFGVARDDKGGFFFADSHNDVIRRYDMTTSAITTVAGVQQTILDDIPHASLDSSPSQAGTFWHPTHLAFQPPNILYVSDRSAGCIRKVELLETTP